MQFLDFSMPMSIHKRANELLEGEFRWLTPSRGHVQINCKGVRPSSNSRKLQNYCLMLHHNCFTFMRANLVGGHRSTYSFFDSAVLM